MMYCGVDSFYYKLFKHHEGKRYIFRGIISNGLLCETPGGFFIYIPFGKRFIPTRCTGQRDVKDVLMYAGDVVYDSYVDFVGVINDFGNEFRIRDLDCYQNVSVIGGSM